MRSFPFHAWLLVPLLLGDHGRTESCTRALRRMEGWTIVKVTTVNGTFEGCDFNRIIQFLDGTGVRCSSYGYQYAYMPDAILFGKSSSISGRSFTMLRLLVEGEMYDIEPLLQDK